MLPRSGAEFDMGRVIGRTGRFLASHAPIFLALSALGMLPLLLMALDGSLHPRPHVPFDNRTLAFQIFFVVFVALVFALLVAVLYAVQALLVARALADPDSTETMQPAIRGLAPSVAIGLLSYCCIALGIALVVPGLFLMAAWSVAIPVCVMERLGIMASIRRSQALTKGCRLKILGLLGMIFGLWLLLEFLAVLAIMPMVGARTSTSYVVGDLLTQWACLVVTVMVAAAATAAIYSELCRVKEGSGPQQLAAAFD